MRLLEGFVSALWRWCCTYCMYVLYIRKKKMQMWQWDDFDVNWMPDVAFLPKEPS